MGELQFTTEELAELDLIRRARAEFPPPPAAAYVVPIEAFPVLIVGGDDHPVLSRDDRPWWIEVGRDWGKP